MSIYIVLFSALVMLIVLFQISHLDVPLSFFAVVYRPFAKCLHGCEQSKGDACLVLLVVTTAVVFSSLRNLSSLSTRRPNVAENHPKESH